MKITINEQEIVLKNTFRSAIAYEQITEKTFNPRTVTDMLIYFYCVAISSADMEKPITLDEFISWLDDNPNAMTEFSNWVYEVNMQAAEFNKKETKKKVTRARKPKSV